VTLEFPIELEILGFEEGGNPENLEKTLGARARTQTTYDAGSGNRTRDALVGSERSRHYATPAPQLQP